MTSHELAIQLLELEDMRIVLSNQKLTKPLNGCYLIGFSVANENHLDSGPLDMVICLEGEAL